MAQTAFCISLALFSLVLFNLTVDARSPMTSRDDDYYDDIILPPLDFEPVQTSRPITFKLPKVDRKPEVSLDNRKQENSGSSTGWEICAKAIVACCDRNDPRTCYDLEEQGCPGPFFDSPCHTEFYTAAKKVAKKYSS